MMPWRRSQKQPAWLEVVEPGLSPAQLQLLMVRHAAQCADRQRCPRKRSATGLENGWSEVAADSCPCVQHLSSYAARASHAHRAEATARGAGTLRT